ncbi:endonuclease/exonuclease/phosphatase family protein [Vibrio sp. SCSIO 43136]|uniref:endonuclease/exonuclease/phosphatase family protein n=1 Tax=Vibrio sp. SCSIO 43136 TaxID=2819101 RepID=UPI002074ADA2|nr:endonuclease/exonuclease/phosphatase family protein [Vibrio sp. SCSIO 43136]USD65923.1 endonuclease/exonuclease/phosphatase family protein [Vibrio sp. SCSIO 43136]
MKKSIAVSSAALLCAALVGYFTVFSVPDKPELVLLDKEQHQVEEKVCFQNATDAERAIDQDGQINLLVWNIYKQNRSNWAEVLGELSQDKSLVLLQEASITEDFNQWLKQYQWASSHVSAFKALDTSAGVLNLSRQLPIQACAFTQKEPWLQLPKSGLYAVYSLSNGQSLAVVNIHAVNFTVGTVEFSQQITALRNAIGQHKGPIIIAGDFNAWSEERTRTMYQLMASLTMKEVELSPDNRTRFVSGYALDYVFYRGLTVKTAKAPETDASDHNPLLVEFTIR